jgi:hypothetical protein
MTGANAVCGAGPSPSSKLLVIKAISQTSPVIFCLPCNLIRYYRSSAESVEMFLKKHFNPELNLQVAILFQAILLVLGGLTQDEMVKA